MPWKSIGLSVRGKLLSSISLLTRGKFSPGVTCTIIDVDHAGHARTLNVEAWRIVWNKLADVWDKLTTRGQITAVHKSWDRLAMVMASKIDVAARSHLLDMSTYANSEAAPIPLQLYFATVDDMATLSAASVTDTPEIVLGLDEGVICCRMLSPCTYELPEYIRDIFVMQDYLNYPDIVLKEVDGDYTVVADIQPGKKGSIHFDSSTTLTRYMWITVYREKKNKELVERFGPEVGYNTVRADEYDTFCDLYYLRFLQLTGVSNKALELGLTIMQNWPYTRFRCSVRSITGTTRIELLSYPPTAITEGLVYELENNNGLPFQILQDGEWVDLKPGDVIEAGTPITAAVRSYDIKNEPDLATKYPIGYLERFHKTVIAFNSNIDYLDDIWSYTGYAGVGTGFAVGDMITGSISGAWGYIIQSMHGGTVGKLELRRVVGDFLVLETISDEHGNQATMATLGDPHYDIDDDVTDAYLVRNKRTGSDFTALVWIDFAPGLLVKSTYGSLNHYSPGMLVETSMSGLFSPSILFESTGPDTMNSPSIYMETDYAANLAHEPDMRIETDYGMVLAALNSVPAQGTWGGFLNYYTGVGHVDYHFADGEILTQTVLGIVVATAVITSNTWNGIKGILELRHVMGVFRDSEVITGEGSGDAYADGVLHS